MARPSPLLWLLLALVPFQFVECYNDTPPTPRSPAVVSSRSEAREIGIQDTLKTVSVDEVFSNPAKFQKPIKMTGTILSVDASKATLFLGCEDACIRLPVRFTGTAPEKGKSAIAVGKVIKVDDKFLFDAQKVEGK